MLCCGYAGDSKKRQKSRENLKTWRCRDLTTLIYCSLKLNKYGTFVYVITVKRVSRSVIILPENTFNEGWTGLTAKIEFFINKDRNMQKLIASTREDSIKGDKKRGVIRKLSKKT